MSKNTIYILVSVFLGALLIVGVFFFTDPDFFHLYSLDRELPYCLKLHTNNASIQVRYSDNFVAADDSEMIQLFKKEDLGKNDGDAIFALGVSQSPGGGFPFSVEKIIEASKIELPEDRWYKKTIFNGYDAAISNQDIGDGTWTTYRIPYASGTIDVYFPPIKTLSIKEKEILSDMKNSIRLSQEKEDIKIPYIEKCR